MNDENIILTEVKLPEWTEEYPFAGNVNFKNGDFSLGSYYIHDAQHGQRDPETTVEPIGTEYTGEIDGISLSEYIEEYVTYIFKWKWRSRICITSRV